MSIFGVGRTVWRAGAIVGAFAATLVAASAQSAKADEIIITIESIQALDRIDPGGGQADFFARVTIAGEVFRTPVIRRADVVRPNWVISKRVRPGTHRVKLEILDKDALSKDDVIDINRLDGKRDLDFRVRTRPCVVLDFAEPYRCTGRGVSITRAGREKKSAEVRFNVNTRRR
jgi:hypothetical protein